jgi:hypothetical protein
MNRRKFLLAAAALAGPTPARAQQVQRMPVIGFLHPGFSDSGSPVFDALHAGLHDLGYAEGESVRLEGGDRT